MIKIKQPEKNEDRFIDYGFRFEKELLWRALAELFIGVTILLTLLQTMRETLGLNSRIFDFVEIAMFLVAFIIRGCEFRAKHHSSIGDFGRRADFYLILLSDKLRKKTEVELEKYYEIRHNKFEETYSTQKFKKYGVSINEKKLFAARKFRFLAIINRLAGGRKYYKSQLRLKYFVIWFFYIVFTAIAFWRESELLIRFVIALSSVILVPYIFETGRVIFGWNGKDVFIAATREKLVTIDNKEDLYYLFLEYSITVQDIFTVPNEFFKDHQEEINEEFRQFLIKHKDALEKDGIEVSSN